MKFFFDNCISHKLAKAIHALVEPEHTVSHLRDHWHQADRQSVSDKEWITNLGREGGWVVVSGDIRIRSRPAERDALRAARLTTFFLADGFATMDKWEQVRWEIDKWPEIVDLAARVATGSTFRVPKRGKIETV
jgi:alpha-ketoglutarate-dependent taurine dioxygenase